MKNTLLNACRCLAILKFAPQLRPLKYALWLSVVVYSSHALSLSPAEQDAQNITELVTANHIIADQGIVDGFGHISVRSVVHPDHYFMSRSRAPAMVTAQDIIEYDLDDNPVNSKGQKPYLERFIHSEIYKQRPDVQSIIHSHSPAVIPYSVSTVRLKPISHSGGFLVNEVPVFEIRDAAGEASDMLVKNKALGAALAQRLGQHPVVLMRGHGMAVVGSSIRVAVSHAVYTERNAVLQTQALQLGGRVSYLTIEEAKATGEFNDGAVDRPWEIWAEQARLHSVISNTH